MKLTIFTPTYNRANLLFRLYQSLLKQNNYDFEWLIVDDGSTDDTQKVVEQFYNNGKFSVKYYLKENGGKHTAHNMAIKFAQGDYFMCLDSDDWLADNAIQLLCSVLDSIKDSMGVIAYKTDEKGRLLSDEFPNDLSEANTIDLSMKYHCTGEFTLIYPTNVLLSNPFPVFDGEKFVTECVLYDKLSKICMMRLFPEIICICEYQDMGYSNNSNSVMKNNPAGFCLFFMQRIDLQITTFKRIIVAGKYHCFCSFSKSQRTNYSGNHKLLVTMTKPLGLLFSLYYKMFRSF